MWRVDCFCHLSYESLFKSILSALSRSGLPQINDEYGLLAQNWVLFLLKCASPRLIK